MRNPWRIILFILVRLIDLGGERVLILCNVIHYKIAVFQFQINYYLEVEVIL